MITLSYSVGDLVRLKFLMARSDTADYGRIVRASYTEVVTANRWGEVERQETYRIKFNSDKGWRYVELDLGTLDSELADPILSTSDDAPF